MNNIEELMQVKPTPFYVYEKEIISNQINKLKEMFTSADILYSIKANPFPEIVKLMGSKGIGADAASLKEVILAHELGIHEGNIYYSTPGKTKSDIKVALGKCIIVADSYQELQLINEIAITENICVEVGVRINPDFSMFDDVGVSSKFGIDEESFLQNKTILHCLSHVKIIGIHVHVRSQVLEAQTLLAYYQKVYNVALNIKETMGFDMNFINFGGGVGTVYSESKDKPLDQDFMTKGFTELLKRNEKELNARLLIESGRYLTSSAGSYITEIVDIKTSRGKKYLIVKNGLNGFMRLSIKEFVGEFMSDDSFSAEPLFTSRHAYDFKILTDQTEKEMVDIVGHLCTSTDVLATNISLPKAKIGDKLIVSNAGSYAYSLSPILFSSQSTPKQYLI